MTPLPSSQGAEPRQVEAGSWTGRAKALVRRRTMLQIEADPHFRALKPRGRRLMRVLVAFHDPATGHLPIRTKNAKLMERCECSESTLKRARREVIESGWIAGYAPGDGGRGTGDGGWAGCYTIARTPEEAAAARALRQAPDAPYWPAIPERERLGVPGSEERRARPAADKGAEDAPEKRQPRQRKRPAEPAVETPAPPAYRPLREDALEGNDEERRAQGVAAARAELARRKAEREQQRAS